MTDIVDRLMRDKWHISGVDAEDAAAEIDRLRQESSNLRAVNTELLAALAGAWDRMDRARDLLTGGAPTVNCNWGMLDTSLDRAAIKHATA